MRSSSRKRLLAALVGAATLVAPWGTPAYVADAERGRALYTRYCASCHGAKGDGAGPAGRALAPKPTDFTKAEMAGRPDDELARTIAEGGAAVNKSPLMAPWRSVLDDGQIRDLVAYIRALAPAP